MSMRLEDIDKLRFPEAKEPTLLIESWSNSARTVQIRGFTRDGTFYLDHTTNSDRSKASDTLRLPGFPLMIHAAPSATPVRRGELYVRLTLQMAGYSVGVLSTGYLTDSKLMTWPPGIHEGSTEGPGLIKQVTGTNPAANTNSTETVPTNVRWRLLGYSIILTADATTADRRCRFIVDDGTNPTRQVVCNITQQASEASTYFIMKGHPNEGSELSGLIIEMYMPDDIVLFAGHRIRFDIGNRQTGDDLDAPFMLVEEWIEE